MQGNINRIFVYGTLRKGQGACRRFGLEEQKHVGTFRLGGWELYNVSWFPGAVRAVEDGEFLEEGESSITGDVFELDETFPVEHLDGYEGYDPDHPDQSLYIRREIEIDGSPCYIYEYNGRTKGERIASGDWSAQA